MEAFWIEPRCEEESVCANRKEAITKVNERRVRAEA